MNPHFIFNSLNSIQNFIVQNDSKQSNRYLAKFAKLMRMVLANSQRPKVSIEDEMTTLSFYLELEALRFNQALSYEIEIDKSIDKEKALIPTLLIQPFVENAIKHGVQTTNEQSSIDVVTSIKNAEFHFCVVNTKPNKVAKLKRKGMGLENVRRRLNLLYPNAHVLEINEMENEYQVNLTINITA